MADFSNIPTGLKINSQIPLDIKGYALNEATLAYLGVDDNLAFTYHEGILIVCIEEKTIYEWREVGVGEENTGLVAVDFTYPADLDDVYGINYSERTFNFFKKNYVTTEELDIILEDYFNINLPSIDCSNLGIVGGPTPTKYDVEAIYKDTVTLGDNKTFRFSGIGVPNNGALVLAEYSFNDFGTVGSVKTIEFDPQIEIGVTAQISGDGSVLYPLKAETLNPQKTIGTFPYELTSDDDQYTIFVNNAASNVVINIPDTLKDNFTCVFIQKGTGTVTLTGIDASVVNIPSGLTNVIKGQFHQAILEKDTDTVNYYIGGSLTATP